MIKFARISNKTRSNQRPPKLIPLASAAFLAAYRPTKPVKKTNAANEPAKPKPEAAKPESPRTVNSPASKPAAIPPRISAQPPAGVKPTPRFSSGSPANPRLPEKNGSQPDKNPSYRTSHWRAGSHDAFRPKTQPAAKDVTGPKNQPVKDPPAAKDLPGAKPEQESASLPGTKPQQGTGPKPAAENPPDTAAPEKKPEMADSSNKPRFDIPARPSNGKSITDNAFSAPVLPHRTQTPNGRNGSSGLNGASNGKVNGNRPAENGAADKKSPENMPATTDKRTNVPENKPVSSLWSKDVIPVQLPMDPPSQLSFTNTNGKNHNGHSASPDSGTRLPDLPPRLEHAVRGIDRVRLGLERLLKLHHDDLPVQTAVLGVCDDGLPVLLDLNDPTSGAVLLIGDEREAQLDMLRTAVASMADRGTPSSVQFIIFSCDPEMWRVWVAERGFNRHCLAVVGSEDDDTVREWVIRLADWTEQRRAGQHSGPPVLMVMDSLSFLPRLAYDVRLNFDWMAKEGPSARIWPLAAVSTELATALGMRILRGFATRILGYASDPAAYMRFADLDEPEAAKFGEPGTFAIRAADSWLRFHLPRLP